MILSRVKDIFSSRESSKIKIGQSGESLAISFLKKKGHKIIARNYKKKWFEIDIISRKGNTFHFIEVKTIILPNKKINVYDYILPIEQINQRKIKKIQRGVNSFFKEKNLNPEKTNWQIDFLGLKIFKKEREVEFQFLPNIH